MKHILNVFDCNACRIGDVLDGQIASFIGEEKIQNAIGPITDVGPMTEIGQRFFWATLPFLDQR